MDRQTFMERIENEEVIPAKTFGSDYTALYEALLMGRGVQRLEAQARAAGETLVYRTGPEDGGAELAAVVDRDSFLARVDREVAGPDYAPAFEAVLMGSALQELTLEASARDESLCLECHGDAGYWEAGLGSRAVTGPSILGVIDCVNEMLSEEPYDELGVGLSVMK